LVENCKAITCKFWNDPVIKHQWITPTGIREAQMTWKWINIQCLAQWNGFETTKGCASRSKWTITNYILVQIINYIKSKYWIDQVIKYQWITPTAIREAPMTWKWINIQCLTQCNQFETTKGCVSRSLWPITNHIWWKILKKLHVVVNWSCDKVSVDHCYSD
jgi:hypothetical protein